MSVQSTRFNQWLPILMVVLYLVSLAAFSYAFWRVEPEHVLWSSVVNAFILSFPLLLFFGSIYVLISAWYEHRLSGQTSSSQVKLIHWAPRIAAKLIIFFVTLFSFDVFGGDDTLLQQIGALLMHSLPSIVMILLLIFAWRWHKPKASPI